MNDKARLRKAICEMIKQNRINIRQAAEQCDICYGQMLRVYKKYILEGDAGLIHGNRGQTSTRNEMDPANLSNGVNFLRHN